MKINLKDPANFTLENVRKFISSVDDSKHRQLRVSTDGIAYISDIVGNHELHDVLFRLETFQLGNGYVGADAAADEKWVKRIYEVLKKNYPIPSSSFIEIF